MLDTNKDYREVFGPQRSRGIVYRQDDKMFNIKGFEINNKGELIEEMPVEKKPEVESMEKEEADLMFAERIRIVNRTSDGYMTDAELRQELNRRGQNVHHATGRPRMIEIAKKLLGL